MSAATEPSTAIETVTSTEGLTLAAALVRFARVIERLYADASQAHGLTAPQTRLLCLLFQGPVGMTDLSRLLHLERSSLTGLVDRVQQRGLVERIPDDHDGRACQIALTSEGLQLALASHIDITRLVDETLGELTAADEQRLLQAIKHLLAHHQATS